MTAPANPWGVSFLAMFHMANDSGLFKTRAELEKAGFELVGNRFEKGDEVWLPLYEAKMIHQFDHRFAAYDEAGQRTRELLDDEKADPVRDPLPRYWVPQAEVEERLARKGWTRGWLLGWRDICRATDERTVIASLVPRVGVGNNLPLMLFGNEIPSLLYACLLGNLGNLALDFIARFKVGGTHLNFFIYQQLPVLGPDQYSNEDVSALLPRVIELAYTSWSLKPFADDVWREADEALRAALVRQWEEADGEWRAASGEERMANGPGRMANGARRMVACGSSSPEQAPSSSSGPGSERGGTSPSSFHSPFATHHSPRCPLPPFPWNPDRRARLRAELDALYAQLYGLTRKQLRYILDPADLTPKELEDILDPFEEVEDPLDEEGYLRRRAASDWPSETFRVLRDKEERQYGHYRTRRLVLEAWEGMEHGLARREVPGL